MTYVTADLTGEDVGQLPSSLGNYELMVCVREELSRAADMISRLARYTCEAELEAGATMDLPDFFSGSIIKALVFAHPSDQPVQFEFLGQRYGLLLCIGITAEELAFGRSSGSDALLALLRQRDVFPYTVLQRESVTP
ncbi:MAG: suppressor of fused domain protein [Verrucomicrobia bacterium]|nr:suppressor of fused domain protein [Verrucomicrobiota bacterium]